MATDPAQSEDSLAAEPASAVVAEPISLPTESNRAGDPAATPAGEHDRLLTTWPAAASRDDATDAPARLDTEAAPEPVAPPAVATPPTPFPTWTGQDPEAGGHASENGEPIEAGDVPTAAAGESVPSAWSVGPVERDAEAASSEADHAAWRANGSLPPIPAQPPVSGGWARGEAAPAAAAFTTTPEASALAVIGHRDEPALLPVPSDAGRRAAELLDELRSLLPALGATRLQPDALAERLESALEQVGDVPDGLRAAMDAARTNPRDIDTVLDLTRRIDDVLALIDHHDRLADAVHDAVRSLRSGGID